MLFFYKISFYLSIPFDTIFKITVFKKEDILNLPDQLKTNIPNETIKILFDKNKIVTFVKIKIEDWFTCDIVDLLHFTIFNWLDFCKYIQHSDFAKEYS